MQGDPHFLIQCLALFGQVSDNEIIRNLDSVTIVSIAELNLKINASYKSLFSVLKTFSTQRNNY